MAGKSKEEKVSIRAYASTLGVDEKTVRNARDAGLLGNGYDKVSGKIIPSKADKAWGDTQKVIRPKAGVSREKAIQKLSAKELLSRFDNNDKDDPDAADEQEWLDEEELRTGALLESIKITSTLNTAEAMRRREIIALALDKKKLEEAEGVLVRRDKMEKALFILGSELKKALLDIPARCARDIMVAATEVEGIKIMTDELMHVLNTYGALKNITLN